MAAVALVASWARPERAPLLRFGRARPASGLLLLAALAASLGASLLWALLVSSAGAADDQLTDLASAGWFAGLWVVVALVLVAPLAEELLFRRAALLGAPGPGGARCRPRGRPRRGGASERRPVRARSRPGGGLAHGPAAVRPRARPLRPLYVGSGSRWPPIVLHALLNALVVLKATVSAAALLLLGSAALVACAVFLERRGAPRLRRSLQRRRGAAQAAPISAPRRPTMGEEG